MKLLIIEDEQALSDSIFTYLNSENFVCETAYDFAAAMEKIALYDYTCIILDINLPGGSGLDILKELKANHKTDGVLVISARNSVDDKVYGLKTGADDYLAKPFHLSELGARVDAMNINLDIAATLSAVIWPLLVLAILLAYRFKIPALA